MTGHVFGLEIITTSTEADKKAVVMGGGLSWKASLESYLGKVSRKDFLEHTDMDPHGKIAWKSTHVKRSLETLLGNSHGELS